MSTQFASCSGQEARRARIRGTPVTSPVTPRLRRRVTAVLDSAAAPQGTSLSRSTATEAEYAVGSGEREPGVPNRDDLVRRYRNGDHGAAATTAAPNTTQLT
ncbi:hypothetical protein [Streptomyces sp. NPDC001815]|uniref:hypothetical protein n=1 Tax=Streptomyces sp. NPDC001815 TaxID=3154526 RepID=UPI00331A4849